MLPIAFKSFLSASLVLGATQPDECAYHAHFDASSLCLLLAIAVLSYLLGYLAGQMQFPDSPTGDGQFPQAPEDLV
jgi:hypothetical protein